MQCRDVAERLLAPEPDEQAELREHLEQCPRCAFASGRVEQLDRLLRATLVSDPPQELQQRLLGLAYSASVELRAQAQAQAQAATEETVPFWRRLLPGLPAVRFSPNLAIAQGFATLSVILAGWQVFAWLSSFRPVLGDPGFALELLVSSPAVAYLSSLPLPFSLDLQSLVAWSLVGLAAWIVFPEGGPFSRAPGPGRGTRT